MSKREKRILIVDPDEKSRRILEVSLRKTGCQAVGAADARAAIAAIEAAPVDLILSETALPDASGFDFCRRVRSIPALEGVPFVFITRTHDMAEKLRGLELGVEEYLTKPVYVAEVRARVEMLLHRREAELVAEARAPTVSGSLSDVSIIDLFRTIEDGRKTGALRLEREGNRATVYFEDGQPLDARVDLLVGEEAVYRLLAWNDGDFTLKLLPGLRRPRRIDDTFTDLVVEGLQRSEQFDAVSDELAAHEQVLRVDLTRLAELIDSLPEPVRELLHLFDGRRLTGAVIDESPLGDLATIRIVQRLLDEGLVEVVRPLDDDEDEIEALAAVATAGLDDWLGAESPERRAEREAREAHRREEERQLKSELEQLQLMETELTDQLRAAEEARLAAETASAQLHERQEEIRRRLTGELPAVSSDHAVAAFQPTPSSKRKAPTTREHGGGKDDAWLGLASDAETAPRRGDEIDTFDYPALKVPVESPPAASDTPGFRSPQNRVDTNPRFRSDMAADAESRELTDLRQSIDSERRRLQETRRKARDEERRATDSQRALERAKSAYEELERAEELRRLQAEQDRLETERHALVAQRQRLQSELLAEREQLERERTRLRSAAAARRSAQDDEESRLKLELDRARQEREEEEKRLADQRLEAERLKREVARQEAALRERSSEGPAVELVDAAEPEATALRTSPARAADPPPIPKAQPPALPPEVVEISSPADETGEDADPDELTGPLPATLGRKISARADTDRRLQAVEEARRRLLDAASRSEEKLLGRSTDTPGPSVPRVTQPAPSDTPKRLAAIAESKRRLSTLVAESRGDATDREQPPTSDQASSARSTPSAGVPAVAGPPTEADESVAESAAATPVDSQPERAPGEELEELEEIEELEELDHTFFSAEHDDLYAALYDEAAPSRTGRNLLFVLALVMTVLAVVIALVSTGDDPEPRLAEPEPDPVPTRTEELAARQARSEAQERAADDVDDAVVLALRFDPFIEAFGEALRSVSAGLTRAASTSEADAFEEDLPLEPLEPDQASVVLDSPDPGDVTAPPADDQPDRRARDEEEEEEDQRLARREEPEEAADALDVDRATERARTAMSEGDYGEAAAEARQVLEAEPANRRAHQLLGESLLNLDEASDAIPHLEAATSSRRPNDRALMLLGNAQLDAGDQEAALATYRRYLELFPDTDEARELRNFLAAQ